jgi:hypothetical protein
LLLAEAQADPEGWFVSAFKKDPRYQAMVDELRDLIPSLDEYAAREAVERIAYAQPIDPPHARQVIRALEADRHPFSGARSRFADTVAAEFGVSRSTVLGKLQQSMPAGHQLSIGEIGAAIRGVARWANDTHARRLRVQHLMIRGRTKTAAVWWNRRHPDAPIEAAPRPRRTTKRATTAGENRG